MMQGRSARLACAAERTEGELCATACNRRLFSGGGGGGGDGGGGGGDCGGGGDGGGGDGGGGGGGGCESMTEIHIIVCGLGVL